MTKFKPKSITEKLFTKENVFQWIETLEEAIIAMDNLKVICDENNCNGCPFDDIKEAGCAIYRHFANPTNQVTPAIETVLNLLYVVVEKNKWEDEE